MLTSRKKIPKDDIEGEDGKLMEKKDGKADILMGDIPEHRSHQTSCVNSDGGSASEPQIVGQGIGPFTTARPITFAGSSPGHARATTMAASQDLWREIHQFEAQFRCPYHPNGYLCHTDQELEHVNNLDAYIGYSEGSDFGDPIRGQHSRDAAEIRTRHQELTRDLLNLHLSLLGRSDQVP